MKSIPAPPCDITITAPVIKRCPVKREVDEGSVTITYRSDGAAFELHELAQYLSSFAERHVSHEDFTFEVSQHLDVDAVSTWITAGMEVRVVVLRQPVH